MTDDAYRPVRCNNCEWSGTDRELDLKEFQKGDWIRVCPICKADAYLIDVPPIINIYVRKEVWYELAILFFENPQWESTQLPRIKETREKICDKEWITSYYGYEGVTRVFIQNEDGNRRTVGMTLQRPARDPTTEEIANDTYFPSLLEGEYTYDLLDTENITLIKLDKENEEIRLFAYEVYCGQDPTYNDPGYWDADYETTVIIRPWKVV